MNEDRTTPREEARIADLINIMPEGHSSVLEIGARDGYITNLLVSAFEKVTALDLEKPEISNRNIETVQGDVTSLHYKDNSFDTVFCTEVLEHVPPALLKKACNEIVRVAAKTVIIGVPNQQDIRVGRTTCVTCGKNNPPWGHVNVFNEKRLKELFAGLRCDHISFVWESTRRTNFMSAFLMDIAGNPSGTYDQDEACIHCGSKLKPPPAPTSYKNICRKLASSIRNFQSRFLNPRSEWIHLVFHKEPELNDRDSFE